MAPSEDTPSNTTAIATDSATEESAAIGAAANPAIVAAVNAPGFPTLAAPSDGVVLAMSVSCPSTGETRISYSLAAPAGDKLTRVVLLANNEIADDSGIISADGMTRETTLSIDKGTTHRFQISYQLASNLQAVPTSRITCTIGR